MSSFLPDPTFYPSAKMGLYCFLLPLRNSKANRSQKVLDQLRSDLGTLTPDHRDVFSLFILAHARREVSTQRSRGAKAQRIQEDY